MTREREIERVLEAWLEPGPSTMPDRVFDTVLDRIEREPQRRGLRLTGRIHPMTSTLKLVAVTVLATAVGLGTFALLATTTPTAPASSPSPQPSLAPSPKQVPSVLTELEAGTYTLGDPLLVPESPIARMTATVPAGWHGIKGLTFANLFQDSDDFPTGSINLGLPSNFFVDPCDTTKGLWDPPLGPTVDDFVSAAVDIPGYTVTEPTDVTLLGYPGHSLELTGPASVAECTDGFAHGWETPYNETAQYLADGQHVRLWVMDIDGTRLLIGLTGETTVPHPTGTDPASLAEQQAVFDSLRIAPAPAPTGSPSASAGASRL